MPALRRITKSFPKARRDKRVTSEGLRSKSGLAKIAGAVRCGGAALFGSTNSRPDVTNFTEYRSMRYLSLAIGNAHQGVNHSEESGLITSVVAFSKYGAMGDQIRSASFSKAARV